MFCNISRAPGKAGSRLFTLPAARSFSSAPMRCSIGSRKVSMSNFEKVSLSLISKASSLFLTLCQKC
ncbi:aconitate hydratase [Schizosaccharomyces cryophilus OY26]|uniref:Aconitate hydratase n=1 Tax=Schizosaccharomyces cryophilus (strain OY26 / ATCC MYA-4695 / CBS 11777 / NBRC 106824 / NRRL Y48691) TaxID=653667 RepID=S9W4B6_SCHCR|nr:aconitate hydratase [Schizosaccharomyces cryophilus OY26]EPY53334.1 aconitate hydratase [Schizosaccharomyces cryophilus OY26]